MAQINYVNCYRCNCVFIPINISPTTSTVRCPSCNTSSRLPHPRPPPSPPPPPPPFTTHFDFIRDNQDSDLFDPTDDQDFDSFIEQDDNFNTTVQWTAEADQYEPHPIPAAASFIDFLNSQKVSVTGPFLTSSSSSSCVICSDEFGLKEMVNEMPCGHWFHSECIIKWLNLKNNCPLCRSEVPRELGRDRLLPSPPPESPVAATTLETLENYFQRRGRTLILDMIHMYERHADT